MPDTTMAMPTPPVPITKAATPSKSEVERKLSLRSASGSTPRKAPVRRQSNTSVSGQPLASPSIPISTSQYAYDSDSSYSSLPPPPLSSLSQSASTSSPVLSPVQGGGLTAIAELNGMMSDEGEEELDGEGDGEEAETEEERLEGSELQKGLEGERVIKSGYLLKKGERRKNWKKRWFVLRPTTLSYYKSSQEYLLCRLLPLPSVSTCQPVQLKRHQNCFGIVTPRRTYYVKSDGKGEMEAWVKEIESARREGREKEEREKEEKQAAQRERTLSTSAAAAAAAAVQAQAADASTSSPRINNQRRMSRTPSARREPSNSSISSASGVPSPSPHGHIMTAEDYGLSDTPSRPPVSVSGLPHAQYGMGTVTSSDEEDVYGPSSSYSAPPVLGLAVSRVPLPQLQSIQTDPNKVILSGYLMKMGNQRKIWRKRWFVLTSGSMVYTKSHMDAKIHRQIPISDILDAIESEPTASPPSEESGSSSDGEPGNQRSSHRKRYLSTSNTHKISSKDSQYTFQVITPRRTFKLCAPSEEDLIAWLAALRALINRERGLTSPTTGSAPIFPKPVAPMIPATPTPVPHIHEQPPSPALTSRLSPSMAPGRLASVSPTDTSSYFPQSQPAAVHPTPSASATSSSTTITPIAKIPTDLPPLLVAHRSRSATQSAKSAVADAVKRLHLTQGGGGSPSSITGKSAA